jgi:NMD protein affecting ribosome stability and mRNA decay
MDFEKGQKCTNCGEPDEFSDETMCHECIDKWKNSLIVKERNRILDDIEDIIKKNLWATEKDGKAIALQFEEYRKKRDANVGVSE